MSANSIPGLSAAVVLDGELRWSQGFGMVDLENYSPTLVGCVLEGAASEKIHLLSEGEHLSACGNGADLGR